MLSLLTSSVTHEMITPLKCIAEFGKSILKGVTTPQVSKEAKLIVSTSKLLLSQIKLLLDKNMLDNDLFVPNYEFHSINISIAEVVDILQSQAKLQKIQIEIFALKEDFIVKIDQLRLQQVVINLLSNAVKFSKAYDVITVKLFSSDSLVETNKVELEI
jgi:signal transduction histidine kinase